MSSTKSAAGFSPELRASLYHFTVFGATGVASAYLSVWLSGKGLSSGEIGMINSAPVLLLLFLNIYIGRLADRARDWRDVVIVLSGVAAIASLALFFVSDFWGLLLVYAAISLPAGAVVPIIDAATLRMTQRRGTDFGFVRAWGTVGYTVTAALSGLAIGWLGAWSFVPLFVGFTFLRSLLALLLPHFRGEDRSAPRPARTALPAAARLGPLLRPWFLLPLIAFALIQSTHYFISVMGSLVWSQQGIADYWLGPLIAVSAAAEAVMMFFWRRVGKRFSARNLLIIAGLVAAVRWVAMAMAPPLPLLFVLQLAHAVTYPFSYFGVMGFIANWTSEDIAAEAQSFSYSLTQGVSVVTLLGFGWLVGTIGGQTYFIAALLALACSGAAWWSLMLRPAHAPDKDIAATA